MALVIGVLVAVAIVPLVATALRRSLPATRRGVTTVEPVAFGDSQKSRRSPRHAVLLHRGLVGSLVALIAALALVPAVVAASEAGLGVFPAAFGFALPVLLVGLHVRGRRTET